MVGPRSTGCRNCVSRKIKCDETKPSCIKCRQAKIDCPGFARPFQWVHTHPGSTTPPTRSSRSSSAAAERSKEPKERTQKTLSRLSLHMPGLQVLPAVASSPSPYTDDTYCIYYLERYFAHGNWNNSLQQNKAWFWRALQEPSAYPVSSRACRALVLAFFMNTHGGLDRERKSVDSYRVALKVLRSSLQRNHVNFDTIFATKLMAIYEACTCTSAVAWTQHLTALAAQFKQKGPSYVEEGSGKALLLFCRWVLITQALITRRHSFLEEECWNIEPDDYSASSSTVTLGNILVHAPRLSEDIQAFGQQPEPGAAAAKALLQRVLEQQASLKAWWDEWCTEPGRLPIRSTALSDALEPFASPPALPGFSDGGSVLDFCNLEAAVGFCWYHGFVLLTLYWTNSVLPYVDLQDLADVTDRYHFASLAFGDEPAKLVDADMVSHAVAVCEALPFFCLPRYRTIGSVYMGLPVKMAWQTFGKGSVHAKWIEEMLELMARYSGFMVPRYLLYTMDVVK